MSDEVPPISDYEEGSPASAVKLPIPLFVVCRQESHLINIPLNCRVKNKAGKSVVSLITLQAKMGLARISALSKVGGHDD